jgi:hypothetical protein
MYYYKARIYYPALGRFLQTDLVGYADQNNLYAYIGNDPVDRSDPTGTYGCGSNTPHDAAGCTSSPYGGQAGSQTRTVVGIRKLNSAGGQLVNKMLKDPDVKGRVNEAWRLSKGDSPRTRDKNEYGFWVRHVGKDFVVGRLVQGEGPLVFRPAMDKSHDEMPGADIFVHVHPFRVGELPNIETIGISEMDRPVALRFGALVVSVGRPEPYTRRNVFVDFDDDFYKPTQ